MISFVKGTRLVSYVLRNQFVSMLLYKLNFDRIHGDAYDKIHISRWLVLIRCNLASLSSGVSAASLSLICCNLVSLSSGASTANLSRWLVLIRCNLISLPSGVSAAVLSRSRVLFRCEVARLSLASYPGLGTRLVFH